MLHSVQFPQTTQLQDSSYYTALLNYAQAVATSLLQFSMGSQKRKRESYATPTSNADAASTTPETSQPTPQVTNVPFKVEFVKPGEAKSKREKGKIDYDDHTVAREEAGITVADKPITYIIIPGSVWDSMKKYKNFIGMFLRTSSGAFSDVINSLRQAIWRERLCVCELWASCSRGGDGRRQTILDRTRT